MFKRREIDNQDRGRTASYLFNNYRGLISCTNSDMVESLPLDSENSAGMSEADAPFVTPLGHSLVIMNQGINRQIVT